MLGVLHSGPFPDSWLACSLQWLPGWFTLNCFTCMPMLQLVHVCKVQTDYAFRSYSIIFYCANIYQQMTQKASLSSHYCETNAMLMPPLICISVTFYLKPSLPHMGNTSYLRNHASHSQDTASS